MTDVFNNAVSGLNHAAARVAAAAQTIVNATSTNPGSTNNGLDAGLVALNSATVDYAANAKAVAIEQKTQKSLLNILA